MVKIKKSNIRYWIYICALAIVLIPITFYVLKFGQLGLSPIFQDWVDFSVYLSPFMVTSLTILLAYISWQSLEIMKIKEKPIIVVEKRAKAQGGREFLSIRNIGSGPALDIKLFIRVEHDERIHFDPFLMKHGITSDLESIEKRCQYHYMVSAFSLSHSEVIFIDWQESVESIGIVCTDTYGRKKSIIWNEFDTLYSEKDEFGVDKNGFKGEEMIYKKDKSPERKYDQVFSLAEIGKKDSWVLT